MASALDFDPGNSSYWSERHRDIVFGANYNAFATKFTGFSICHPVYDDTKMLKCVQHSLRSAMCSELPNATLFLPNWETRASMPTEHWCKITRNTAPRLASSSRQNSHMPTSWKGIQRNFSNHTWSMDIIAVWNKEPKQCLTDGLPNWLQTLQRGIPEAVWEKTSTLQERTQTTSPTMFAPSTSVQKERTSLARKEAKTLTSTSNHGTISSSSAPIGNC